MLPTQSVGPFLLPDYPAVSIGQWEQHLQDACRQANDGLKALANPTHPADFKHAFMALERVLGTLSERVQLFFAAKAPHATPDKEALAEAWAEKLAELDTRAYQDPVLFARCQAVSQGWPDAPPAERRMMDKHLRAFRNAGLGLDAAEREQIGNINAELARLGQQFQSLCQRASAVVVVLSADAARGLPGDQAQAARQLAVEQDQPSGLAFVLQPMAVDAFLADMEDRTSRRQLWEAAAARGSGLRDDRSESVARRILELRARRAHLLGHPTPAHHLMEETMAGHPDTALGLVLETWKQLQPALQADLDAMKALAAHDGIDDLEPWDVPFYTARYRQQAFGLDEQEIRQFLPLEAVRQGAFEVAGKLFGLSFEPVAATLYHPDTQAYLVRQGERPDPIGLLVVDDYVRDTKASGAWMDNLRPPSALEDRRHPWVINVCNFPKPADGQPALLTMEDATTVFHELGHALHSLLTTARYPSQAGTNVAQDFVELPSQILENWVREPAALAQVARHWQTREPIPAELVEKMERARKFGQGVFLARYLASAYLDLALHSMDSPHLEDLEQFQANAMAQLGLPAGIAPRHGLLHFSHLFSDDAYAAGYYSYLWAEVLEADAFTRFREDGLFDPVLAQALLQDIYAPGGSVDPAQAFERFMGRPPAPQALLAKHGLLAARPAPRP